MLNLTPWPMLLVSIAVAASSLLTFLLLLTARRKKFKALHNLLHIPATKSKSNAILLGGLGLSVPGIAIATYLLTSNAHNYTKLILAFIFSSTIISAYGYFDDKVEIRARQKLFFQSVAIVPFAIIVAPFIPSWHPLISFAALYFGGLAVLNGSNLLDGLDTLSIKLALVAYLAFAITGLYFGNTIVCIFAMIFAVPICIFYIFNKVPAKIHLGEIGGNYIGLTLIFLAILTYHFLHYKVNVSSSISFASAPLLLPILELAISFSRRLLAGKSPFVGDRLHVHYIIFNKVNQNPSHAANLMAISQGFAYAIFFTMSSIATPFAAFIALCICQISLFVMIGTKHWKKVVNPEKVTGLPQVLQMDVHSLTTLSDSHSIQDIDLAMILPENVSNEEFDRVA